MTKMLVQTNRAGFVKVQSRSFSIRQPKRSIIVAASKAEELKQMEEYKQKLNQNLQAAARPSPEVAAGAANPASAAAEKSLPSVDATNFWDTVKAESAKRPVVIDVYTAYCGPCKAIAPKLVQWQDELGEDKIKIYKFLASAENKEIGKALGVRTVPTFIFFNNGEETGRLSGAKFEELEKMLKEAASA